MFLYLFFCFSFAVYFRKKPKGRLFYRLIPLIASRNAAVRAVAPVAIFIWAGPRLPSLNLALYKGNLDFLKL